MPDGNFYKLLHTLLDFEELAKPLEKLYSKLGRKGYPPSSGLKCLMVQFLEDLSDRQLEEHLQMHIGAKFFCGFQLSDKTPDHTYFCYLRRKIGTNRLAKLFNRVGRSMKRAGYIREVFTFVDASKIEARVNNWVARDKALEARQKKLEEERRRIKNTKRESKDEPSTPQSETVPVEKEQAVIPSSIDKPVLSNKNMAQFSSASRRCYSVPGCSHRL